jgi:EmrB/QacA subfamily drug resistance transporter
MTGLVHASARTRRPERRAIGASVWRLASVIVFGAFTSGLDSSLANIGLNTIRLDLHTSLERAQWVSTGYLVALALSLPICGWLGRKVGVGLLWLVALAAFTVSSALCAAAPDINSLIGLRVLQGLAAGLLIPAGQTILGQAVGSGRLGRVMATLGVVVTVAPALGPIIGGLVLHSLSWRWLFLINLPIGAAGLVLGLRLIPREAAAAAPALDWLGFVLIGTGLPLVVYALTMSGSQGTLLSATVLIPLLLGVLGLAAFVLHTRRRVHPLIDLALYRNPVYTAASGAAAFTGAVMFGGALLFPLYFQLLHGAGVVQTGLLLLSLGGGTTVALPVSGRLTDRYGGGIVSVWGTIGTVVATVPFAFLGADANPLLVQGLLVLLGMGIALAAVPPGIAAYQTVRREQLPDATTGINIMLRIGGALGAALITVILARGLPEGTESAFHAAFWWLAGFSVVALGWALWLWTALRGQRSGDSSAGPDYACAVAMAQASRPGLHLLACCSSRTPSSASFSRAVCGNSSRDPPMDGWSVEFIGGEGNGELLAGQPEADRQIADHEAECGHHAQIDPLRDDFRSAVLPEGGDQVRPASQGRIQINACGSKGGRSVGRPTT